MDDKKEAKFIISAVLCFLTMSIFSPGSYSNDTWAQYIHITIDWNSDWFGVGLTVLWKTLMNITGNFYSLYYFQMICYWIIITMLARDYKLMSVQYLLIITAGVFFSFIPQYLMRDSTMSLFWSIAAIIMLRGEVKKYLFLPVVFIVLLSFYGLLLRPNALVALVPFLMAVVFAIRPGLSLMKSLIGAAVLTVVFSFASNYVMYDMCMAKKKYPVYKLELLDLTGISKLSGENYLPECIIQKQTPAYDYVMNNYTPASMDDVYWSEMKPFPEPDSAIALCVHNQWKKALAAHPFLYIKNRTKGFLYYLKIKKRFKPEEYFNTTITIDPQNPLGLQQQENTIRDTFTLIYNKFGRSFFFDPWFWLVLNIVLFAFSVYRYRKTGIDKLKILACIQLSGVIFILSQFPVFQHDKDFRYNYWSVFVVLITMGFSRLQFGKGQEEE